MALIKWKIYFPLANKDFNCMNKHLHIFLYNKLLALGKKFDKLWMFVPCISVNVVCGIYTFGTKVISFNLMFFHHTK